MDQLMNLMNYIKEKAMIEDVMWYIPEDTLQAHTYQVQQQQKEVATKTINNYLGDTDGTDNFGDC